MKDEIIEEIRKIRKSIDEMIDKNPKQFESEMESIRTRYKNRLVRLEPRYIKNAA